MRQQAQQVQYMWLKCDLVHVLSGLWHALVLKTAIVYVHVPVMDEKRVQKSSLFGQLA